METMVISYPTQAQLDELFPLGEIETDEQAKQELGVLYEFIHYVADRMHEARNEDGTDLIFNEIWEKVNPGGVLSGVDKRTMAPHLARLTDEDMQRFVEGAAIHELPVPPMVFDHLMTRVAKALSAGICTRMVQRRYPFIRFDVSAYVAFQANIKDRKISIDHTVGEDNKGKTA